MMEIKKEVTLADLPDDTRKWLGVLAGLVVKFVRQTGDPEAHKEITKVLATVWEDGRSCESR